MFERYVEKARRTIFFARFEASQFGSPYIETEHLLLGLLREDKVLVSGLLRSHQAVESIRQEIERSAAPREKVSASVDLPLSQECKCVLAYGAEEAERLNHKLIGTEHLLLGLLREERCFAAQLLHERGVSLESLRAQLRQPDPPRTQGESASLARVDQLLLECEARSGTWTVKQERVADGTARFAIYAREQSKENEKEQDVAPAEKAAQIQKRIDFIQAPLLCIDIIREEAFSDVQKRCDGYIAEGVNEVWLLDAELKRAYTVTKAEGLQEFKGEILRAVNPPLEMDLRRIFD